MAQDGSAEHEGEAAENAAEISAVHQMAAQSATEQAEGTGEKAVLQNNADEQIELIAQQNSVDGGENDEGDGTPADSMMAEKVQSNCEPNGSEEFTENVNDDFAKLASIPRNEIWRRSLEGTETGNSEIEFPDGTTYSGEWLAKQESKYQRTIIRHDGSWYEGEWDYDRQHGEGEAEFPDGTIFNGRWEAGLMRAGKMQTANGNVYVGQFEDNKMHGTGEMTYAKGASYKGDWSWGKRHGRGVYKYSNGNIYDGGWTQDFPDGEGKYTSAKGWEYEGQFELGKRHGKGKLKYRLGDEYVGHFRHGSRHGKGKFTNADGGFYDGEWVHDRKHGHGTHKWKDPSAARGSSAPDGGAGTGYYEYTGEFDRGLRSGWGKLEYPTGELYEGEWLNNLRHGQGVLHARDFSYEGSFRLDKRHGRGTFHQEEGVTYVGEFENGVHHGEAKLITGRGTSFLGSFLHGVPHGPAIIEQELRPGLHVLCRCEYDGGRRAGIARVEGDGKSFTVTYDAEGNLVNIRVRPQKKEQEREMMRTYGRALVNHRKEMRSLQEGLSAVRSSYPSLSTGAAVERSLGSKNDPSASEHHQGPAGADSSSQRTDVVAERESLALQTSSARGGAELALALRGSSAAGSAAGPPQPQEELSRQPEAAEAEEVGGLKEEEVVAWLGAQAAQDPVSRGASVAEVDAPSLAMPDEVDAES